MRNERTTQTLERGLDLLLAFSEAQPTLSVAELAEVSGLPLSTTYRLVQTLDARGFVCPCGGGRFRLGPSVLRLLRAARPDAADSLGGAALPVLRDVSLATGETSLLTIINEAYAVCVESVPSPQQVRLSFQRGRVLPLWAGASAKVLLAYTTTEVRARALALPGAPADRALLAAQLGAILTSGYASTLGEVDAGVRAIAVPVLSDAGVLLAGISVAGPCERMPASRTDAITTILRAAAARLAAAIAVYLR